MSGRCREVVYRGCDRCQGNMCCREVIYRGCDRCQDNICAVGRECDL